MKHLMPVLEGGYPLDDVSIAFLQSMYNERDAFVYEAFGNKKIVKGMIHNTNTNDVSDGLITYNGKLYHFTGGQKQDKISMHKNITKRQFKDGSLKDAFEEIYFTFGDTGSDVMNFTDLKRWYRNNPIKKEFKYVGASVSNADLQGTGWFIADGSNGTDDLRSRFIVGFDSRDQDYNTVGKTGGEKKHQLTVGEMPSHNHEISGQTGGDNSDNSNTQRFAGGDKTPAETSFNFENTTACKGTGGNEPHENRPPYYVAVIIQFIGT